MGMLSHTAMVFVGGKEIFDHPVYSVTEPSLTDKGMPCNNIFLLADDNGISRLAAQIFSLSFFSFADSDDSDTEGGLGNVERVVMRPPGHSGKAKRGHLCFDSSFETGHLHS